MDGGSSINILYYETFRRMGLGDKDLRPSNTVFHGVVPGKSAYPVGKIALEVAFGDDHDSRSETLTFEVVKSKAHTMPCLAGRPMPNSWRGPAMCICSSRCRVTRGLSRFTEAARSLWNARKETLHTQNRFALPRSSSTIKTMLIRQI